MNYWVLINFLLLLCSSDYSVGQQLKNNGFIEILPSNKWKLLPGEKNDVEVIFEIKDGFHIQADKVLEDHLIPTSLSTQAPVEIIIGDPLFPVPYPFHLKNVDQKMLVFHKEVKVRIPVVISESSRQGNYLIKGNLHYQVCDSLKCYFPRDFPFKINIEAPRVTLKD
jgi:hypothetical protein